MMKTADSIRENSERAKIYLKEFKEAVRREAANNEAVNQEAMCTSLRNAVCSRLMIDAEKAETDDIRKLCILSIRRQMSENVGLSDREIVRQIEKYDCHQTNLVTQKRVLLMLYVERELNIRIGDDEAVDISTTEDLARVSADKLRRKQKEERDGVF